MKVRRRARAQERRTKKGWKRYTRNEDDGEDKEENWTRGEWYKRTERKMEGVLDSDG